MPCSACGDGLAVELADLLDRGLEHVDAGVALDAVVVREVLVVLVELGLELEHQRVRRVDRQAHVRHGAVGRVAGQVDHLLAGQRGLAHDRLGVSPACATRAARGPTLPRWCRRTAVGVALLGLQDRRREVDLARVGGDVGHHLHAGIGQRLGDGVAAALAEVVVDEQHRRGLGLQRVAM
jgi:hypothetical protein